MKKQKIFKTLKFEEIELSSAPYSAIDYPKSGFFIVNNCLLMQVDKEKNVVHFMLDTSFNRIEFDEKIEEQTIEAGTVREEFVLELVKILK